MMTSTASNSIMFSSDTSWHDLALIPVDSNYDNDSDFFSADDSSDGTVSIAESVRDYVYENGRTYHAYHQGKYALPNDEQECSRLNLFHHLFRMRLDGELFIAPVKDPQRVLDIGTGTGVWAVDMAEEYPNAEITGNDLSPIQPTWTWPNVNFEIDDVELDWTHPDNHFDFIHIRSMMGSINNWDRLFEQAYRCIAPGGYIEFQDQAADPHCDDGTLPAHSSFARWMSLLRLSSTVTGRAFDIAPHIRGKLERAGFVGVHQRVYKWPIGGWPKDQKLKNIGRCSAHVAVDSLGAFAMGVLTRCYGWAKEDVDRLVGECEEELRGGAVVDPEMAGLGKVSGTKAGSETVPLVPLTGDVNRRMMHIYDNGYFVYARKPFPGEMEAAAKTPRRRRER